MKQPTIIKNSFGKMGLKTITLIGVVLIIIYFLFIYNVWKKEQYFPTLSLPFLLLPLSLIFSHVGILLNLEKGFYKNYFSLFGIKWGLWKPLDKYKELILLRSKQTHGYGMGYLEGMNSAQQISYELYLVNQSHFDLLMINLISSREKGEEEAVKYAQILEMDWVKYNPGARRPRQVLRQGNA